MFVPKAACTCRILAIAATAIILAGLNVPMATAQVLYGSMVGNVRDTSEASVPGADVTVRNMADNQTRSALTNESGSFLFATLPPGEYEVSVAKNGFRPARRTGILVSVNNVTRFDLQLEVGTRTRDGILPMGWKRALD